jgi:hypothetical protein
MKDQIEQPEDSPADLSETVALPTATSEPAAASLSEAPDSKEGAGASPAAMEVRPAKRRKAAPKRRTPRPVHASRSTRPPQVTHHYENLADEGDDDSFIGRHRTKLVIAAVVLLAGGAAYFFGSGKSSPAPKAPEHMAMISLPPLPPPPPPPPPPKQPPPPPEQKMVQETAAEEKPKEAAPKAPEPPKEALGTNVKGNGPGIAGLGGSGNGGGFGGPGSGGGGSKYGFFAGQVQTKVASALRSNNRTKKATLKIQVRIWSDSTGRITRAKLDSSTGDPSLDGVIQDQILTGLQLDQPPPAGMPMPIVMRLTARRP